MHCLLNMNMVNSLLMDTSITWAPLCKTGLHLELVPPFIWLSTRRKSLLDGYLVSVLKVSIFIKESESRKFFFGLFSHSQKTHLFALLAPFTDCNDRFPYPFIKFYLWNPYHMSKTWKRYLFRVEPVFVGQFWNPPQAPGIMSFHGSSLHSRYVYFYHFSFTTFTSF